MSTAASVRAAKDRRPEYYCSDPRCLYRTFDARTGVTTPCPKHEEKHPYGDPNGPGDPYPVAIGP